MRTYLPYDLNNLFFPFYQEKGDNSVDIYTLNNKDYKMEIDSKRQTAIWQVKYKGNPTPTLVWYDNFDRIINGSDKYEVIINNHFTTLKINYLGLNDSGFYTLKAANSQNSIEKKFELIVKGKYICRLNCKLKTKTLSKSYVCRSSKARQYSWTSFCAERRNGGIFL